MKNKTTKILAAFALLLCFITGQAIVFTHSHVSYSKSPSNHSASANNDENCKVCQLNHDAAAILNIERPGTSIYGIAYKQLRATTLSYQSISLVLAATRGPPAV